MFEKKGHYFVKLSWNLMIFFNPKGGGGGGGPKWPYGFSIGCHFSQDQAMITKILDFINKHPKLKVVKSFSYYLYRFFRNLAETDEKLQFFWSENRKINFFSIFS